MSPGDLYVIGGDVLYVAVTRCDVLRAAKSEPRMMYAISVTALTSGTAPVVSADDLTERARSRARRVEGRRR